MPRRSKDKVATRARSVFDDYHDGDLAVREIGENHGVSLGQVYRDVAWWWSHYQEFGGQTSKPPKKVKRKQTYDELWDMDAEQLLWHLNVLGVEGVASLLECSRQTVWRATRANGLRRQKDGKYRYDRPDPNNPADTEAHLKMLDARPRQGPPVVVIDAQVGRGRTRSPSLWCDHEWETLTYESPIPSLSRSVTRCRYCLGERVA